MAGEREDLRLEVKRGPYAALVALSAVGILCASLAVIGDPHSVFPMSLVVAFCAAVLVTSRRTLAGPRAFAVTAAGLRAEPNGPLLPFAEGMVAQALGTRLRGVLSADGRQRLRIPHYLRGDSARVCAALAAGIQAALPVAYSDAAPRLAARGLAPPEVLEESLQRTAFAPGLLFATGPRPAPWSGARIFLLALLGTSLAAIALGPDNSGAPGAITASVAGLFLVLGLVFARQRRPTVWLHLHADGLALIRPNLSGEIAWTEVLSITPVKPGFPATQPSRKDVPFPLLVRIETSDQAQVLIASSFDAPLGCIIAAMRQLRYPGTAAAQAEPA